MNEPFSPGSEWLHFTAAPTRQLDRVQLVISYEHCGWHYEPFDPIETYYTIARGLVNALATVPGAVLSDKGVSIPVSRETDGEKR